MKYTLLAAFVIYSISAIAQPQAINYQGVARNAQGFPLVNRNISLRLSILDSSATGQAVYVETQNVTTSSSGLFNLGIGLGTIISGAFSSIPWGQGDKWLKTEMDTAAGSNYNLIGTTQFLSVPYALHSATANSISTNLNNATSISSFSQVSLNSYKYFYALDYCTSLTEGGFSDWRLPTIDEIQNYIELNGYLSFPFSSFPVSTSYTDIWTKMTLSQSPPQRGEFISLRVFKYPPDFSFKLNDGYISNDNNLKVICIR